jgi:hypothetical protein
LPGWDWWRTYPWSPYNYGRNPYNPIRIYPYPGYPYNPVWVYPYSGYPDNSPPYIQPDYPGIRDR